jgi:ferrochelatase
MRYGQPSIESVFRKFQQEGILDVTVFPLYPQYSLAATETSIQECRRVAQEVNPEFKLQFVGAFYRDPGLIQAFAEQARNSLKDFEYDHLLFSFHGLPERHVKKTDRSGGHCLQQNECCSVMGEANQDCYRAQCFQTANAIARELGIKPNQYTVCFQSRLGRNPWIKPYTDHLYASLPTQGIKRVAVMCPAFVADCLETLEEIEIRGREEFIRQGGEDLRLVPSLNSSETWSRAVAGIFERQVSQFEGAEH